MQTIYEDRSLLVINKPAGHSVHDAPGPGKSLLRELRQTHGSELHPVHRLDKDASGVLILARSIQIVSELNSLWPGVEKTYLALCEGVPPEKAGRIDAPILENQTGKPERLERALKYFRQQHPGQHPPPLPPPKHSGVHPAGRPSQTDYRLLQTLQFSPGLTLSLLEVRPRQGRMHQIRVHLSHLGVPLAVDPLYGRRCALEQSELSILKRLSLHAQRLELSWRGQALKFEAPLPEDLAQVIYGAPEGNRPAE